jgi:hypothetical protein
LRGIVSTFQAAQAVVGISLSLSLSLSKRSPGAVLIGVTATQQRPLVFCSFAFLFIYIYIKPPDHHRVLAETASRGMSDRSSSPHRLYSLRSPRARTHTHRSTSTTNEAGLSATTVPRRPTVSLHNRTVQRTSFSLSHQGRIEIRRRFVGSLWPPIETHSSRTRFFNTRAGPPIDFFKPFRFEFFFSGTR